MNAFNSLVEYSEYTKKTLLLFYKINFRTFFPMTVVSLDVTTSFISRKNGRNHSKEKID